MSDSVELSGVEETLMIPLWARALATRQGGLIDDPASVELVERLEYDFEAKLGHARWLASFGVVRVRRFDEAVRDFIDRHPDGAVVDLGCGLDTRWERCDGRRVDWFDLDLDAAIALRRRHFRDTERRKMIAAPLQGAGWHELVGTKDRPFLFVAEGVLLYLEPDDVAGFIRSVSRGFPASSILLDTIPTGTMNRQDSHPSCDTTMRGSGGRWTTFGRSSPTMRTRWRALSSWPICGRKSAGACRSRAGCSSW